MTTDEVSTEVRRRLAAAFGPRFRGLVLHGSSARGEAARDSDLDYLVLLDPPIALWRDIGAIVDATYDLEGSLGRSIDALPVAPAEFERAEHKLYRRARRDGVRVA